MIQYPDVAHYQAGLTIQPGTPVLFAKVTQGSSFVDPEYSNFKNKAASVGAVFGGYHWLEHGNVAAQAAFCFAHNGTVPAMIDAEETVGARLTIFDITGFIDAYRALGGIVNLLYLPRWYWSGNMGSPSLAGVVGRGIHLVASEYRAYSDTAWPGAYGGMTPEVWQFTSTHSYGGQSIDFNAYKGTKEQFAQMIGGTMTDFVAETFTDVKGEPKSGHDFLVDVYNACFAPMPGSMPSKLDAILKAVTTPAVLTLTDAQITQLATQVTAAHPKLGAGDEPAIVDALKTFFGPAVRA